MSAAVPAPAVPAPAVPAQVGVPGAGVAPAVPAAYQPAATTQPHPGGQPYVGGQSRSPTPGQPGSAPVAYPVAHPGFQPPFPPGPAPVAGAASAPRARRSWPGVAGFVLALALAAVVGVQAYQVNQLSDRLGDTNRRLAEAQAGDRTRFEGLEGRAEELEEQAGKVFDPEAISTAVLPSVFRVRAGEFTGTAFAVGKPTAGGGTNLFTNFHVVESVWDAGGRKVFLERTDQRFPATIVKVDKDNDVAQLKTDGKFAGLLAATTPVKSGQQIVVVGAPLGLEDTVTTGVVSAFRKSDDGSGTVIQFDAPINPGNSGGPVINGAKQVVGIATAKAKDAEGIGLAVPIKTACDEFRIC